MRPVMDSQQLPMHVVLFFTYGVSLKTWSDLGLLAREVQLYRELAERGVRVTFVTYGGAEDAAFQGELGPIRVIPLYTRARRPKTRLVRILHSVGLPFRIRDVLREASVLKTNQVWGGWNAVLARWMSGKPLLARIGFNPYLATQEPPRSAFYNWVVKTVMRLTFSQAQRIHVAADSDRTFLEEALGLPAERIFVRMNYVDTHQFRPIEAEVHADRLLYVGRLHYEKNLPAVISALSGTRLGLDVVGTGDDQAELEQHARRCGVAVRFLGTVPNEALPPVLCRYPVFVLCSKREGNPKALLEAMACGRAVVGSNVPGINTLIRHEENGLLCGTDPDSIRLSVVRLMRDAALRSSLGGLARRFVEEHCSLEGYLEHELAAYHQLAGVKCA